MKNRLKSIVILSIITFKSFAQFKDSTNKVFLKKMITPVGLTLTSVVLLNENFKQKQNDIYQKSFVNFSTKVDDYLNYLPILTYTGLSLANSEKRNERLLKGAFAISATNGTSWILKRVFKIERPDKSEFLSYPSGHTTNVFTGAALLNKEFGGRKNPIIGILGYTVATGTGFLRMANNKHWLSDVLAGAAIGIGGTEVSYFLYPKIKKIFDKKIKSKNKNQSFVPYYDGQSVGLVSSISF